ncbi:uncharacterized protein [Elaeis guineensis]|uniref:Uncharacterized protein LOC105055330 n=1 Tax=Elaeis guineensis var. tenera TaxID=51953 RepID=A0A6J0PPP1_ELAGV|nr:uncharacterized protein LOC105055330 [Elaeis guineensis]
MEAKNQTQSIIFFSSLLLSFTQRGFTTEEAKMAGSAVLPDQCCHLRSISMPSRSHPLALQVEEELHKLRTFVASSSLTGQMICNGLRGLGNLYNCIKELLYLPHNQQVLTQLPHKKWVEELLDGSLKLLDLCDTLRDKLVTMKEHIQDLQLALRRRGDAAIQSKVHAYIRAVKKAQKDMNNCLKSLKQMDNRCVSSSVLNKDSDLSIMVQVLTEAKQITMSLLQTVLSNLFMARSKPKSSRWSSVSKALHKKKVACEEHEDINEAESSDFSFSTSYECITCKDGVKVQNAQEQLEGLEFNIEGFESGLECLFRQLVQNRVSLLNILSL